ncbi:tRNA (adenosine(37)-N6)-dimethylallyltransferase MiaA [uncultured Intestinimonas sp.]|uniref:tRNA (adenosine(37)-N6)-dimethylallyltransferase MiaA n=1 Tax=uncultured Intestinimonas sp. TaxID=1689265 RepID=UPI0025D7E1FF|nr:tRNA (adenosine(37)-N6)-dimethylallyltransferase MiaA [uncultured Intestinimonas sp.]
MEHRPKLLVICGPTASGKTALGVALAQALDGEVVSADSMQIYRGMDIGTAKPTAEEMGGVPHHMLDVADPAEDYSVARYVHDADACVGDILARGKLPIVVGGTGLYIDNLIAGRDFAPFTGAWRERLQARAREEGLPALHEELRRIDPDRAEKLHPNDEKRILRALEVWYETGETITAHDERTRSLPPKYDARRVCLNFARREDMWERIDRRVDLMMEAGLEEEVRNLLTSGVPPTATAMQAIGYKEFAAALRGEEPVFQAVAEVKLRSRQYAKRQLTWFRRTPDIRWVTWENTPDLALGRQKVTAYMEEFGI